MGVDGWTVGQCGYGGRSGRDGKDGFAEETGAILDHDCEKHVFSLEIGAIVDHGCGSGIYSFSDPFFSDLFECSGIFVEKICEN